MGILALQWAALALSWLSLPLMGGRAVRRFMPVALFVTVLNSIVCQMAWHYHWWVIQKPTAPWSRIMDLSLVYGVFLVGTMWIFYFTYGHFWRFVAVNAAAQLLFALASPWIEKAGILELNTSWIFTMLLMFGTSLIIYPYQLWQEGEAMEIQIGGGSRTAAKSRK